jgi:hypothetical protein
MRRTPQKAWGPTKLFFFWWSFEFMTKDKSRQCINNVTIADQRHYCFISFDLAHTSEWRSVTSE